MAQAIHQDFTQVTDILETPGVTPQFISLSDNVNDITEKDGPAAPNRVLLIQEMESKVDFFHPEMSRHISECVLLKNGRVGSYLFRTSTDKAAIGLRLALSVRCFQSVKHYEISWDGNEFKFGMGRFTSVEELLEHFSNYPVIGGDSGVLTMLKFPYPRTIDETSIYDEIKVHAEWKPTDETGSIEVSSLSPACLSIASKEGYLVKIGAFHKNWKLRWFVCLKMQLAYYGGKEDAKPLRKIDLNTAIACDRCIIEGRTNCFKLETAKRTFYFDGHSQAESNDWIKLLKWKIANQAK